MSRTPPEVNTDDSGREGGVNVFVYELSAERLSSAPDTTPRKFVVEDNVGEGIHVHWRNLRFEMSIEDFERFADHLAAAQEELDGHR